MSQNLRNTSFNNDFSYNSSSILETDSPVARDRFSRFSRLAESMDQSKFGLSMLAGNSGNNSSLFNESTPFPNRSVSTAANVSEISSASSIQSKSIHQPHETLSSSIPHYPSHSQTYHNHSLQGTLQLPVDNEPNDGMDELMMTPSNDEAHLAIFESFFELNQRYSSKPDEIFEMLDQFDQTCEENFLVNNQLLETKVRTDYEVNYYKKLSSLLRLERNSWRLMRALLGDRILNQKTMNLNNGQCQAGEDNIEIDEDMSLRLSDHELIERAFERNGLLREMQIVIDWLESVYDEETPDKVDFYSDGPNYWENTLYSLKQKQQSLGQTGTGMSKGRQYCQQMDPDASIRTGLPLHDLDKEDENRLLHYIYKLVRSGHLQDGKEIAQRLGYFWLSAALEGWILHHDPNYQTETSNIGGGGGDDDDEDEGLSLNSGSAFGGGGSRHGSKTVTVKNLQPQIGNPYRDLWKHTAWKCSKMEGTNVYERTIFAIFSGNRSAIMPLCTKWSDKLWAYFKCSLDVHLENLLTDSNIVKPDLQPRNSIELPDAYWDNKLSPEEIFREIETQFTVGGGGGGGGIGGGGFSLQLEEEYHQTIQKCLVLNKINELIDHLYEWSKTIQTNREARIKQNRSQADSETSSLFAKSSKLFAPTSTGHGSNNNNNEEWSKIVEPNLLRFFGHIVIVLKQLELIDDQHHELCVEILEIYIGYLIEFKLIELVAFYVGFLPEHRQVKMFATLLEDIDDLMDRKLCLVVAKTSKLNLPAITTMVVENIRMNKFSYQSLLHQHSKLKSKSKHSQQPDKSLMLTSTITEADLRKSNSLDWLLLDEDHTQYLELLWQANALIRQFLLEQKLDIAVKTFEKLPTDIVGCCYEEWKSEGSDASLWNFDFDIENVVREYFCNKVFFEAHEAFQKWHHFLYNTKPRPPTKPKQMPRLADRVAYEQSLKQYEQEMQQWNSQIKHQATLTAEKIVSFLSFPECVWVDIKNLDSLEEGGCLWNGDDDDAATDSVVPGMDGDSVMEIGYHDEEDQHLPVVANTADAIDKRSNIKTVESIGHGLVRKQQQERKQQEWSQRTVQLDGLRRIFIPQFISLLHSVYRDSGNLAECLRIADLVADENRRLYTTLSLDQLKDLLNKLRETSITILNQCSDPLGYVGN